jgi:hypothetical protein
MIRKRSAIKNSVSEKEDLKDYEKDLKVDLYSLETQWEVQPELYMKWAKFHAEAISERDRLKEKLELVRSELSSDIRKNPAKYGLEKVTEAAVNATVVEDQKFIMNNHILIDATENVNVLAGAKEAIIHKKAALENLVKLWLGGYYAKPEIPQEAKDVVNDEIREEQKRELNKGKRRKIFNN